MGKRKTETNVTNTERDTTEYKKIERQRIKVCVKNIKNMANKKVNKCRGYKKC